MKENRAKADAKPEALTVMAKEGGRWFWIKATPDAKKVFTDKGQPIAGKDVAMCAGCHAQAPADEVFTHDFGK
ncbi:MAG: hypothetical protein HYZ28_19445 [Myxococcales bacterium]|nr:hypothetical protein [Myxococcales bacterium]